MIKHLYPDINCQQALTELQLLLKTHCKENGVSVSDVTSPKRDHHLVKIRAGFIEKALKTDSTKISIMNHLNRHHSTFYNYEKSWLR